MLTVCRIDNKSTAAALSGLMEKLADPGPFHRTWAAAVANDARISARGKGGRRFWRDQIAGTIEVEYLDDGALVFTESAVAAHKEYGGPIKAKYQQSLTVPFAQAARGKSVKQMEAAKGKKIFRIRSKKGNAVLGYSRKKGKKTEFVGLYALVKETRPQRPDPWWPTADQVLERGVEHAGIWLNKE